MATLLRVERYTGRIMPSKGSLKQFCKHGHDTFLVGRAKYGVCKACRAIVDHKREIANPERRKNYNRATIAKRLARNKIYNAKNAVAISEWQKNYNKNLLKIDPMYKAAHYLRVRLNKALKAKKWFKNSQFSKYMGCTSDELKSHLEKQFQPGMTWNNHTEDGWHIDHIVPLDSAKTPEELYKLCHYSNLQPLWAKDNLRKSNR
jgi:hypothetical protein